MLSQSGRIDGIYTNLNMFRLRKLGSNRGLNMSAGHFFRSMCKYLSCSVGRSKGLIWTFYELVLILTLVIYPCTAHTWESPGCHRVGEYILQFCCPNYIFTLYQTLTSWQMNEDVWSYQVGVVVITFNCIHFWTNDKGIRYLTKWRVL